MAIRISSLLIVFLVSGCGVINELAGGSGAGNPVETDISISISLTDSAGGGLNKINAFAKGSTNVRFRDAAGLQFNVTEALANLYEISLEKFWVPDSLETDTGLEAQTAESEDEVKVSGPHVVSLLGNGPAPGQFKFQAPADLYEAVEIIIDNPPAPADTIQKPDPLNGYSMSLRGTYKHPDSIEKPFQLNFSFAIEIEIKNTVNSVVFDGDSNYVIRADLNTTNWFKGVDIHHCLKTGDLESGPDGVLYINGQTLKGACADVMDTVKTNVRTSIISGIKADKNEIEVELE